MVEIRPLVADEGEQLRLVYESVAAEERWIGGELPVPPQFAVRVVDTFVGRTDAVMFVAVDDGVFVGWLNVRLDEDRVADLGMGIVDGYRGQGLGTDLMLAAIEWASAAGATRLRLEVFSHNERARRLYEKFGFQEVERRIAAHLRRSGERWDGIVMERDLDL